MQLCTALTSQTHPYGSTGTMTVIEIQNPGGLYGMASPENFPRQTDYRNPVISEAMATLGYVNAFGRGVIRAQDALSKNGNPEAEFAFEPSHVLATIRRKP